MQHPAQRFRHVGAFGGVLLRDRAAAQRIKRIF